MPVAKGKERITITIHKETKDLLEKLLSLHDSNLTYSNLIEIAVLFYGEAVIHKMNAEAKFKEKEKKN